jgi:hypothetical protein
VNVIINKADLAQQVTFSGNKKVLILENLQALSEKLSGRFVTKGDVLKFRVDGNIIELVIVNHTPEPGIVMIHEKTHIFLQEYDPSTRWKKLVTTAKVES